LLLFACGVICGGIALASEEKMGRGSESRELLRNRCLLTRRSGILARLRGFLFLGLWGRWLRLRFIERFGIRLVVVELLWFGRRGGLGRLVTWGSCGLFLLGFILGLLRHRELGRRRLHRSLRFLRDFRLLSLAGIAGSGRIIGDFSIVELHFFRRRRRFDHRWGHKVGGRREWLDNRFGFFLA